MPKLSNIFQDKKFGKWYYVANLGFDEEGKRIRKWGRGFITQKEARVFNIFYKNFVLSMDTLEEKITNLERKEKIKM